MSEWFETGEQWYPSEYGEDDVLGTLNEIDANKILRSARLVREGKVIDLSHEIFNGMPGRVSAHGPFFYVLSQRVYDSRPPMRPATRNKFGGALCRMEMVDHLGTHLDALNHIAYDNLYYNGADAHEISTPFGTTKLGIDTAPPVVTRGLMVDATGDRDIMEGGEPIDLTTVKDYLRDRNLEIEHGDAIFFYTGVGRLWHEPENYNRYYETSPGIGMELARWLAENKISVTGTDTPATEVTPSEFTDTRLPVHQYLITLHGIRLIDNINLNGLVESGVNEFMLSLSRLKIRGATASPVSPLAIF